MSNLKKRKVSSKQQHHLVLESVS